MWGQVTHMVLVGRHVPPSLENGFIPHIGTWSSPPITGTRPPPCAYFSFTKIDEQHAVLFGGQGQGGHVTNNAYLIDLKKMVS